MVSRRERLAQEFPEPEWRWVWEGLEQTEPLHPAGKGMWSALHEMLTADPADPRAVADAREAYAHGGSECFEVVGANFVEIRECEYLVPGKVYYARQDGCVLADPATAQHLVDSSGGVKVLQALWTGKAMSGLQDLDVDVLVAGGAEDVMEQMLDGLDD